MDSVRFGRALGSAAKSLAGAVDAATAPNPSPVVPRPAAPTATSGATASTATSREASAGPIAAAARATARATIQARETTRGVKQGSKAFGEAAWGPLARISRVLWLEITGAFFGIFALFASQAAWTHRADLFASPESREAQIRAFVFLAMALVFGYFCVSSFVSAKRRERSR